MSVEFRVSAQNEAFAINPPSTRELARSAMLGSPLSTSCGGFNAAASGVAPLELSSGNIKETASALAPLSRNAPGFNSTVRGIPEEATIPAPGINELGLIAAALAPQTSTSGDFDSCSPGAGPTKQQAPSVENAAKTLATMQ